MILTCCATFIDCCTLPCAAKELENDLFRVIRHHDEALTKWQNGEKVCLVCRCSIAQPEIAVVECTTCRFFIGHPKCFIMRKCPICIP